MLSNLEKQQIVSDSELDSVGRYNRKLHTILQLKNHFTKNYDNKEVRDLVLQISLTCEDSSLANHVSNFKDFARFIKSNSQQIVPILEHSMKHSEIRSNSELKQRRLVNSKYFDVDIENKL